MAAVAAPVAAQEADQESAQATVRDSAKMVKPMVLILLNPCKMRKNKGKTPLRPLALLWIW